MLRVWLFGSVSYLAGQGGETRLRDRRSPRVLAYLAIQCGRNGTVAAVPKTDVRRALWGPRSAADNLRRTLRELHDDHPALARQLEVDKHTIGFGATKPDVDVYRFEEHRRNKRFEEALAEVRGEFMAHIPEELCDWTAKERRTWHRQVARICLALADQAWDRDERDDAIELARRAQRLQPDHPYIAIDVAWYLEADGARDDALETLLEFCRTHTNFLKDETRAVDAVIARLRSDTRRSATPPSRTGRTAGTRVVRGLPITEASDTLLDEYRLKGWVQRHTERRTSYYRYCDRAIRELAQLSQGTQPEAESVIVMLEAVLEADGTFAHHARRHCERVFDDEETRTRVYRAAAATILKEYLAEKERGTWP